MLNKCLFRMYLFYTSIYELAFMTDQTFIIHCCYYCLATKLCLTLGDSMDCSLSGSSVHGISQVRILEWVAISFSREEGITQGSSLSLLHWQVDSLPLRHQGSPYHK